jgi:hypothetical protein
MIWIGVDAQMQRHQALAVAPDGICGEQTVPTTAAGWVALLDWARQWPARRWTVAVAGATGRALAQFLVAQGEQVDAVWPEVAASDCLAAGDHAPGHSRRSPAPARRPHHPAGPPPREGRHATRTPGAGGAPPLSGRTTAGGRRRGRVGDIAAETAGAPPTPRP